MTPAEKDSGEAQCRALWHFCSKIIAKGFLPKILFVTNVMNCNSQKGKSKYGEWDFVLTIASGAWDTGDLAANLIKILAEDLLGALAVPCNNLADTVGVVLFLFSVQKLCFELLTVNGGNHCPV